MRLWSPIIWIHVYHICFFNGEPLMLVGVTNCTRTYYFKSFLHTCFQESYVANLVDIFLPFKRWSFTEMFFKVRMQFGELWFVSHSGLTLCWLHGFWKTSISNWSVFRGKWELFMNFTYHSLSSWWWFNVQLQDDVSVLNHWLVNGKYYAKTR